MNVSTKIKIDIVVLALFSLMGMHYLAPYIAEKTCWLFASLCAFLLGSIIMPTLYALSLIVKERAVDIYLDISIWEKKD